MTVTVRYSGCEACKAELRVGSVTTRLRASGGVAQGTSPRLPLGHVRVLLVLTGASVRVTASRPVVIR